MSRNEPGRRAHINGVPLRVKAMRYLSETECRAFGPAGHQNEVKPVVVGPKGRVMAAYIYTSHMSGSREPRMISHGDHTYGKLVEAIDSGEVKVPLAAR